MALRAPPSGSLKFNSLYLGNGLSDLKIFFCWASFSREINISEKQQNSKPHGDIFYKILLYYDGMTLLLSDYNERMSEETVNHKKELVDNYKLKSAVASLAK